jgi:hypothetical protein
VQLSATARDADGALIASGEDQDVEPVTVEPGHVGIGYVYLGTDDLPQGTTLEVTPRGTVVGDDPGRLSAAIAEHNLVSDESIQRVVGIARNDNDTRIEGPISVLVMCFDEAGAPLSSTGSFLDVETLEPGQQGPFSVEIFDEGGCPRYLVGVSGYSF